MKNCKRVLSILLLLVMSVSIIGCGQSGDTKSTEEKLELKNVIVGMWITSGGEAGTTARIYKFYESGIIDTYIGDTKDTPITGCYELEGTTLYMNTLSRTNPKDVTTPFTVKSFEKNEIVVTAKDRTITWKRYQ